MFRWVATSVLVLGLSPLYATAAWPAATCPLQYSHGDAKREDASAITARVLANVPLGTYEEVQRTEASDIVAVFHNCIDRHRPNAVAVEQVPDPEVCVSEFAVLYLDAYREYVNKQDPQAQQNAYSFLLSRWDFMFEDTSKGVLVECGLAIADGLTTAEMANLDAEAMLVLGVSNERKERHLGYWRALTLDIKSISMAKCTDGCSRSYWVRKMLEK
ncbi:hypothetical protein GOB98_10535 [Sinorhizobium meliloti]|nr:hypothetical protein [Sinorhizobium meliloti]MDW9976526.1 hypothetical protein [Sinorhizobium meliloti]MDX0293248.1 hypothetical protein [Sinorhizobium meliloti]